MNSYIIIAFLEGIILGVMGVFAFLAYIGNQLEQHKHLFENKPPTQTKLKRKRRFKNKNK